MKTWTIEDAQEHLTDVVDAALADGPQRIARGDRRLVLVSETDWIQAHGSGQGATKSWGELLAEFPVALDDLPPRERPFRERDFDGDPS